MSLYTDDDYYTLAERMTALQVAYEKLRGDARCAARFMETFGPITRDAQHLIYEILWAKNAFYIQATPAMTKTFRGGESDE